MKAQTRPIPLAPASTSPSARPVKSGALLLFRGLRTLADYASQLPGVANQAAADVMEAWHESNSPKQ